MCAIFGLGLMKGSKFRSKKKLADIIRVLFSESSERGNDASGLACIFENKFKIVKRNVRAPVFIKSEEYNNFEKENLTDNSEMPLAVLGHCRLQTQGTHRSNGNNHPIIYNDVVGVHNGCIGNDGKLFYEYKQNIARKAEVDSEIIFALIHHFSTTGTHIHKAIQKASGKISGSMACAMSHAKYPDIVWLFRNNMPCDIRLYDKVGLVVWSSSDQYIRTATEKYRSEIGAGQVLTLNRDCGAAIDLKENGIFKFPMV